MLPSGNHQKDFCPIGLQKKNILKDFDVARAALKCIILNGPSIQTGAIGNIKTFFGGTAILQLLAKGEPFGL